MLGSHVFESSIMRAYHIEEDQADVAIKQGYRRCPYCLSMWQNSAKLKRHTQKTHTWTIPESMVRVWREVHRCRYPCSSLGSDEHKVELVDVFASEPLGKAHLCKVNKHIVVLKLINRSALIESKRDVVNKIVIQGSLKHEHILPLYSYFTMDSHICLVQKYAKGGDLREHLYGKTRGFNEEVARNYIRQVINSPILFQ